MADEVLKTVEQGVVQRGAPKILKRVEELEKALPPKPASGG